MSDVKKTNDHVVDQPKGRDLEETIKNLKLEFLNYKDDNEKLIKDKQHIRNQIFKSLNKIQSELTQKTESRLAYEQSAWFMMRGIGRSSHSKIVSYQHYHSARKTSKRDYFTIESDNIHIFSTLREVRRRAEKQS